MAICNKRRSHHKIWSYWIFFASTFYVYVGALDEGHGFLVDHILCSRLNSYRMAIASTLQLISVVWPLRCHAAVQPQADLFCLEFHLSSSNLYTSRSLATGNSVKNVFFWAEPGFACSFL